MKELSPDEKNTPRESSITLITDHVRKADTQALITNGTDAFPDDSYAGQYWTGDQGTITDQNVIAVAILEPVYKPGTLYALSVQNNTLEQCVEAMEVNIDGTGHSISLIDASESDDDTEKTMLEDFFDDPYPGKSMIEIRRAVRRDIETTGNGYMEVIRTADDQVVMINSLDSNEIRLIRLDSPVMVDRVITRAGKEVKVQVRSRERRFVQNVNGKKIYFKEFNASRDVDRLTGKWSITGVRLPVEQRGSEVIHFMGNKEPKTPYGTPRWINQLPSVLGSRKAEENNLEFFDGGGIPPVLILIEGGALGPDVKRDLKAHLTGQGPKHRAAIVEIASTSGTLDSAGRVGVKVERFSSDSMKDSMFQTYDKDTAEHVRTAFRLPPIFLGKANDYSFAVAMTSYMVAEAQVFYPERDEFDSKINHTIVKALGAKKYVFRSLPMTLVDIINQLKAVELVIAGKYADGQEIVDTLNEITGLKVEYTKPPEPVIPATPSPLQELPGAQLKQSALPPNPQKNNAVAQPNFDSKSAASVAGGGTGYAMGAGKSGVVKIDNEGGENPEVINELSVIPEGLVKLANDWVDSNGLISGETKDFFGEESRHDISYAIQNLTPTESKIFNQIVVSKCLTMPSYDIEGLSELSNCCINSFAFN